MSWKYNPFTGQLDYFEDQTNEKLETIRTVFSGVLFGDPVAYGDAGLFYGGSDPVAQFRLVSSVSATEVLYADSDSYTTSFVLGVSLESGNPGDDIRIQLFGLLEDPSFTFGINVPLYLGNDGIITDVAPTVGTRTRVGHGLGTGSIFIKIEEPILLP